MSRLRPAARTGLRLVAEDVHFSYTPLLPALQGASLTAEEGEMVALIGQNGSGKSTLARLVSGLLKPGRGQGRGRIEVADRSGRTWDVSRSSLRQLAGVVGYVFQNPDRQIFAERVEEELRFGLRNLGIGQPEAGRRLRRALELVGLEGAEGNNPFTMSRGDRQRVALAAILVMEPDVLVVDEPTTGQDSAHAHEIMRILSDYRDLGRIVVVITHDMSLVVEYADRVVVLHQGRVLAGGPPRRVFEQTETLERSNIKPPQITQFGLGLGLGVCLSVEEAAGALESAVRAARAVSGERG